MGSKYSHRFEVFASGGLFNGFDVFASEGLVHGLKVIVNEPVLDFIVTRQHKQHQSSKLDAGKHTELHTYIKMYMSL